MNTRIPTAEGSVGINTMESITMADQSSLRGRYEILLIGFKPFDNSETGTALSIGNFDSERRLNSIANEPKSELDERGLKATVRRAFNVDSLFRAHLLQQLDELAAKTAKKLAQLYEADSRGGSVGVYQKMNQVLSHFNGYIQLYEAANQELKGRYRKLQEAFEAVAEFSRERVRKTLKMDEIEQKKEQLSTQVKVATETNLEPLIEIEAVLRQAASQDEWEIEPEATTSTTDSTTDNTDSPANCYEDLYELKKTILEALGNVDRPGILRLRHQVATNHYRPRSKTEPEDQLKMAS